MRLLWDPVFMLSIKNQKVYFGESKNVPKRLGQHWEELIEKTHECKEMQSDWNFFHSLG